MYLSAYCCSYDLLLSSRFIDAYYLFVCIYLSVTLFCNLMILHLVLVTRAPLSKNLMIIVIGPNSYTPDVVRIRLDLVGVTPQPTVQRTIVCINEWMHVYTFAR